MAESKARSVVAHMMSSVAAISSASASAEALLSQTSSHIRSITDNVEPSDESSVNDALDQLEAFADQIDEQASELSAAVVANTPAEAGGATDDSSASSGDQSSGTLDPHTIDGAAAAGGYNVTDGSAPPTDQPVDNTPPPAAGQHPDAPVEQPQNSTLTELGEGTTGEPAKDDTDNSGPAGGTDTGAPTPGAEQTSGQPDTGTGNSDSTTTGANAGSGAGTGDSLGGTGGADSAPVGAATSAADTSGASDGNVDEASSPGNNEAA